MQTPTQHMKRCSTSATREKQSHSETLPAHWDCHSQKTVTITAGEAERWELVLCWWAWKMLQLLWKIVWQFLKKSNVELLYNPEIYLEAYTQRKIKLHLYSKPCTWMCNNNIITIAKGWK